MQPKVLLVGNDEPLLNTRAMLIARDAEVVTALGIASIRKVDCQNMALVILCHTLSLAEEQLAIDIARKAPLDPRF